MNLTEPHCGTDLGLIRSKAEPQADGSYAITGTKIFISSGEHDLSENIIHLVLAKIAGAPDNVKGISLFIVPKFMVNEDGSLGERNGVQCGSIEHKMGIHGNSTCVMNYDGAKGYLVGESEKGLAAMFIMMNAARLGVGLQGLAQARSRTRMPSNMRRTAARAGRLCRICAIPTRRPTPCSCIRTSAGC
jgi:alkylation response protein AidB-like acyl-CoA dehydrogenase